MTKKLLFGFLFLGVIFTLITLYSIWQYSLPLVSPLALFDVYIAQPKTSGKVVYGFFPYWNLKYADQLHIDQLTHLAYFSLTLDQDGTILKKNNPQELEPGWNKLNSSAVGKILLQSKLLHQKTILTITAMDQDTIKAVLGSADTRQTAIDSIMAVVKDKHFDGINLDFEMLSLADQPLRDEFTSFTKDLKNTCLAFNSACEIDIDVFADSGRKTRLWDLSALSPYVDHVIVMAYDYYRPSSSQAGPIAPLRGECPKSTGFATLMEQGSGCLEQDVTTNLAEINLLVPSQKILLGIPFYGYEWQTATTDFLSNTIKGTGSLASYQRIKDLFSDTTISSLSATWSSTTLSPYLSYVENGQIFQIHYEDPQSIALKTQLVGSANFGGIAIWAIGYEVPYLDIWQPISDYLHQQ